MKTMGAATLVLLAGILAWGWRMGAAAQTESSPTLSAREPVVVELFTSEGCSSCPPADDFLARLDARQTLGAAEVIALEEHVDYWDQQGWKDPFSSSAWTTRQYQYSSALHSGNPYTPEMVIDGTVGFIGGREAMARKEIEKASEIKKTRVEIIEVSPVQNRSVAFKISVSELVSLSPKDTPEVILAITESGLHSAVGAGENSGKELHHSPVLRELKVVGTMGKNGGDAFTGQATRKLDSRWDAQNLRAIAFVQEKKSRRILGAAQIRLAQ